MSNRVSFVIPTHNSAAWLPLAVRSVLEQSHKDVEAVIVDDCSKDSTSDYLAWLEEQKDPRVVIVRNPVNVGRSASRNIGNRAASGSVICVLDADDLATPNRAVVTLAKMARTKAEYVFGAARVIDAVGTPQGDLIPSPFVQDAARKTLSNGIVHSAVAYTKDFAMRCPYPDDRNLSDLGLDDWAHQWTAAMAGVRLEAMVDPIVCAYRVLNSGVSSTRDPEKVKAAKEAFLAVGVA